jgi:hypothetical protein
MVRGRVLTAGCHSKDRTLIIENALMGSCKISKPYAACLRLAILATVARLHPVASCTSLGLAGFQHGGEIRWGLRA